METTQPFLVWLVLFLRFQHSVQGMPAGGAVPPGVGEEKTVVACEDQKLYIVCKNIFNRIDIVSAMFGRKDSMVCLSPGHDPASPCTAQEEQIKQNVKDLCQGEEKCEVSASNDLLAMEGTTICPGVMKYLEVKYRCIPRTSIAENEGEVTTNAVTEIVGGASTSSTSSSSSSTSLSSSSLLSNNAEVTESASSSPSSSASSSPSSSASSSSASVSASTSSSLLSSSPASEVQVLLDSSPSSRSMGHVVEELGIDQSNSPSQSSQEVTESIQMTNDIKPKEKMSSPESINETIKKSKIEQVLLEPKGNEIEEEEDASGSGKDEMDEGDDEGSYYPYDDTQEYMTK